MGSLNSKETVFMGQCFSLFKQRDRLQNAEGEQQNAEGEQQKTDGELQNRMPDGHTNVSAPEPNDINNGVSVEEVSNHDDESSPKSDVDVEVPSDNNMSAPGSGSDQEVGSDESRGDDCSGTGFEQRNGYNEGIDDVKNEKTIVDLGGEIGNNLPMFEMPKKKAPRIPTQMPREMLSGDNDESAPGSGNDKEVGSGNDTKNVKTFVDLESDDKQKGSYLDFFSNDSDDEIPEYLRKYEEKKVYERLSTENRSAEEDEKVMSKLPKEVYPGVKTKDAFNIRRDTNDSINTNLSINDNLSKKVKEENERKERSALKKSINT